MNLDKASQWLTIITNLGVIAGLVLLVYELNQNAALMRAEIHAIRAEAKSERRCTANQSVGAHGERHERRRALQEQV